VRDPSGDGDLSPTTGDRRAGAELDAVGFSKADQPRGAWQHDVLLETADEEHQLGDYRRKFRPDIEWMLELPSEEGGERIERFVSNSARQKGAPPVHAPLRNLPKF